MQKPCSDRLSLLAHALGAACAGWWLPQGFPADHLRFASNTAVPLTMGVLSACAMFTRLGIPMTAGLPLFWAGLAAGWCCASPRTGWLPALLCGLVGMLLALRARRLLAGERPWALLAPMLLAGGLCAWAQRAPAPTTRPLGEGEAVALQPAPELAVHPSRVGVALGALRLDLEPQLTFRSRSPDRGWVLFAPQSHPDDVHSALRAGTDPEGHLQIEATTRLDAPVWSHLNTFLTLWITGHQRLELAFSPCPGTPVEVMPSDYPAGRPVRAAYLGADGVFRVVEASSGEKGPFRELASGPLGRQDALGITLLDDGVAVGTITLLDWASQASTALSPTAGWGLPQNGLEFVRADASPDAPAVLFVTLAATSVGRGFDSVGHAPGTYRNRIRLDAVSAP